MTLDKVENWSKICWTFVLNLGVKYSQKFKIIVSVVGALPWDLVTSLMEGTLGFIVSFFLKEGGLLYNLGSL
jgi:hypothetical protein